MHIYDVNNDKNVNSTFHSFEHLIASRESTMSELNMNVFHFDCLSSVASHSLLVMHATIRLLPEFFTQFRSFEMFFC